jgi:hypothetical protein
VICGSVCSFATNNNYRTYIRSLMSLLIASSLCRLHGRSVWTTAAAAAAATTTTTATTALRLARCVPDNDGNQNKSDSRPPQTQPQTQRRTMTVLSKQSAVEYQKMVRTTVNNSLVRVCMNLVFSCVTVFSIGTFSVLLLRLSHSFYAFCFLYRIIPSA